MGKGLKPVKVDTVLILAGDQGKGKSKILKCLAGEEWFTRTQLNIGDKDAFLQTLTWIYEIAELTATRGKDAEVVKGFITDESNTFRPPYGRSNITIHRQVVFVGTTNEQSFLTDPTGARRFWTVAVGDKLQEDAVKRDRDQLWAEAMALYLQGEEWWLTDAESVLLSEVQSVYQAEDTWEDAITEWLMQDDRVKTVREFGVKASRLMSEAIQMPVEKQTHGHSTRLGAVLTRMGWKKRRVQSGRKRVILWFPPEQNS